MAAGAGDAIRVALIGYGLGGEVFHAPLIASAPGLSLVTIVTSDPERQTRARGRYPSARIVDRPEAIWEASDDHDLVVVSTPNRSHVPLGLEALRSGLAVVIDKPLAATAAASRTLASAAAERGLFFSVFQNRRWDADFLTVQGLVEEGRLGPIHRFESRYERWKPSSQAGAWRELGAPEEAGGLLFDLGSHLVDQAIVLFGRPTRVYAEVDRRREGVQVDDDVFLALEHPGTVRTHLWASVLAAAPGPRFRLLGARGTFEKYGMDVQEDALAAGGLPGEERWGREPEGAWGSLSTGDGVEIVESRPGAYETYYAGVAEAMRSGAGPPVDPRDAIAGLEVLEAARESARTGTTVQLAAQPADTSK
ncbi:MAG: Gfo/Idh/MocA family oxidoreductase [Actinomycetota bacterium]